MGLVRLGVLSLRINVVLKGTFTKLPPLFNIHLQQNHQNRFPSPCSSYPSFMPSLFHSACSPSSRFPSSLSLNLSRLWF
ncbi:hypothetical protein Scep_010249 [Stephania cephalantha]|uniref:Uncharacterized protein n=1 Tax=Stephania cephalantha TaxID=152367 RepID=A0AAP0JW01_9MAGN